MIYSIESQTLYLIVNFLYNFIYSNISVASNKSSEKVESNIGITIMRLTKAIITREI